MIFFLPAWTGSGIRSPLRQTREIVHRIQPAPLIDASIDREYARLLPEVEDAIQVIDLGIALRAGQLIAAEVERHVLAERSK